MTLITSKYNDIVLNHLMINGVTNQKLIDIFVNTDKKSFLPNQLSSISDCDCEINFADDRYIQETSNLLFMLQLANIEGNNKVLVIGADLGFSLALIAKLADTVVCIEQNKEILEQTNINLQQAMITNVTLINSNFADGIEEYAQNFDLILVNGAFAYEPQYWFKLLNEHGKIIGIKKANNLSRIVKITHKDNPKYHYYKHCSAHFLVGLENNNKFEF
ncbi:protein-L-isoaspartate O-methyltransferase [Rickettsiales bacterium LUAb2]